MTEARFARIKDLPSTHLLGGGTAMCAGCGGLQAVHQVYDVLGTNTVFVNAAGCMTLLSVYPFTPFRGSWLYTSMASAPAGAQGIRDALDILIAKGRLPREEDLDVVVLSGDGAAAGIGLSATSGAIDRGLDFLYLCYDNEGYGNTGQQSSATTPHGARTATDPGPAGARGHRKDLFEIWVANGPAYAATVIGTDPLDLALAPCPTGWGFAAKDMVEIGRMAVRTGAWPLKEYRDGRVVHTKHPRRREPVESYLRLQQRFRHLFEPERNDAVLAAIQDRIDAYWQRVEP